jgi:hypothetical protein
METESASGKAIVYKDGERLTPNPIGRPKNPPEPSEKDRAFASLNAQGIDNALAEKIWAKYQWWLKIYHPTQMGEFFIFKCSGCDSRAGHEPSCDGVSDTAKVLWPREVVEQVAAKKGITKVNF